MCDSYKKGMGTGVLGICQMCMLEATNNITTQRHIYMHDAANESRGKTPAECRGTSHGLLCVNTANSFFEDK